MSTELKGELYHYGILRKSGRYPWGSGGDASQRSRTFLDMIAELKSKFMSEQEIALGFGMTTAQLRDTRSIANAQRKLADISFATRLKDKGMSNVAIGEKMGIPESSVRALLAPGQAEKASILANTAGILRDEVDKHGYIDVGGGVENQMGISDTKLRSSLAILKDEGYEVHTIQVRQVSGKGMTSVKVLAPPGSTYVDVKKNADLIRQPNQKTEDSGRTWYGMKEPVSLDSNRLAIRYAEEGGADADGVMYLRPGVDDLSLGGSRYAQVRVAVDGTHYLKGMAIYKDDLPDGVDIMFNTNKSSTGDKLDALKPFSKDPDNPFGSMIKDQIGDRDATGRLTKVTSVMNIVNDEGDWDSWSKNLSTQFLSKQSPSLAKRQLDMTYERKKDEFDEINSLTNPAVKKRLLDSYADDVDSSAVHLRAASLPSQRTQVIMPVNSISDTEVYAPNFKNGTRVALVRYPHGGTFEIPELTVNNRQPDAKKLLGNAPDAIGLNAKVAERMSGADFDGDTVLVLPNNDGKIKSTSALKDLKGFDPQRTYKLPDEVPRMSSATKAYQMGVVSNLITDMTIQKASSSEIAKAVRHSMVVIDAEKHHLDYKQSAIDNSIAHLSKKYQGRAQGGASTLISRATSEKRVDERKPRRLSEGGPVDKKTGKRVYEYTGETYRDQNNKLVKKKTTTTKLADTDDAFSLSSGTKIEEVYATHSNKLKDLANRARKESINTKPTPYSPSAKRAYNKEVESLNAKLNVALKNRPRERQAQLVANAQYELKLQSQPDMTSDQAKRVKTQVLNEARARLGAKKTPVDITPREWNAMQAGALTPNKVSSILKNADLDRVKELATPRTKPLMSSAKIGRAQSMLASGYTQAEVASALGVGLTTLKEGL